MLILKSENDEEMFLMHRNQSSGSTKRYLVFRSDVPSKSVSLATISKEKAKLLKTNRSMKLSIVD